jgi:thymidylate synthase
MNTYSTPSEAYLDAISRLINRPMFRSAPRGQPIREILHDRFVVENPSARPIITHDFGRNETIARYTAAEFKLYESGARTVEDFGKAAKFWNALGNPDSTVNSAYGHLIWYDKSCGNPEFEQLTGSNVDSPSPLDKSPVSQKARDQQFMRTPWEWARLALMTDKDTRQAIIKFHKREHLWVGNKDVTCTLYGNFHIRNSKLFLVMHMRSQDVVKGLVYDLVFFMYLQERMLRELREKAYPDLQLGDYTHSADSLHLYERDLAAARKMIGDTQTNLL